MPFFWRLGSFRCLLDFFFNLCVPEIGYNELETIWKKQLCSDLRYSDSFILSLNTTDVTGCVDLLCVKATVLGDTIKGTFPSRN